MTGEDKRWKTIKEEEIRTVERGRGSVNFLSVTLKVVRREGRLQERDINTSESSN